MNNSPLITIITVTYNAERFLDRTLASVQRALVKIPNPAVVEYLIIDGKSTDDTLQIANRYSDFLSKVISEKDKGLYDAMNKGIALATGKFLWFLNAGDELYDADVLSKLIPELEKGGDVYYSDAMMVREDGTETGLRSIVTPHTLPHHLKWQDFAFGMKVCHQAFIAKREIAPLYDTDNLSADIDWEILCLKSASQVNYLPLILCKYLMGGLSVQNHQKSLVDRFLVLRKHFGLFSTIVNHVGILWRGFIFSRKNGRYW